MSIFVLFSQVPKGFEKHQSGREYNQRLEFTSDSKWTYISVQSVNRNFLSTVFEIVPFFHFFFRIPKGLKTYQSGQEYKERLEVTSDSKWAYISVQSVNRHFFVDSFRNCPFFFHFFSRVPKGLKTCQSGREYKERLEFTSDFKWAYISVQSVNRHIFVDSFRNCPFFSFFFSSPKRVKKRTNPAGNIKNV